MSHQARSDDEVLLARLRSGDEAAFVQLVDGLNGRLVARARTIKSSPALAEDIVQETWIGVIRGLQGFEGRSTLRTWIFGILVRRARTLASREARRLEVPLAAGGDGGRPEWEPGTGRQGLWVEKPVPWGLEDPADVVESGQAIAVVRGALEALPPAQRQAVLLRDLGDLPAADVCNILGVSETNLRVLLHRGRARIRRALDCHLREDRRDLPIPRPDGGASAGSRTAPGSGGASRVDGVRT